MVVDRTRGAAAVAGGEDTRSRAPAGGGRERPGARLERLARRAWHRAARQHPAHRGGGARRRDGRGGRDVPDRRRSADRWCALMIRRAFVFVLLIAAITSIHAAEYRFAGRPLPEALRELQARGLRLIYSDDVVTGAMIVRTEPRSTEPRKIPDELLREHAL